jgi:hypothetical protein
MFYVFAEVLDWRAFQHFDPLQEGLKIRRCNTSIQRLNLTLLVRRSRLWLDPGRGRRKIRKSTVFDFERWTRCG